MEQQLHQKEDMGEVLHVVDFDQLKIENQQYLDRIEERNTELLRLKATTGKAVQVWVAGCCQTPSNTFNSWPSSIGCAAAMFTLN